LTNINLEVKLKVVVVRRKRWSVLALCSGDGCPLLDDLSDERKAPREDGRKILRRLDSIAAAGPPRNAQQFRRLREGIFEIKGGLLRVLCFFDGERFVIRTHLLRKPKKRELAAQIDRAQSLRAQYFEAKRAGMLRIVEE
jgi:hypothetical protein